MRKRIECPGTEGQRDLAPLYLAGKLREEEAEAFEAHYIGCPKCREDVGAGAALRELYGKEAVAASSGPAPTRRAWLPLAAAAVLAVVGFGLWQLQRRTVDTPRVSRSADAEIVELKVSARAGGGFDVSWAPQPGAATYEVQVFGSNSVTLWKTQTRVTRVSIGSPDLPAPSSGQTFEIGVRALDSLGKVIASGEYTMTANP